MLTRMLRCVSHRCALSLSMRCIFPIRVTPHPLGECRKAAPPPPARPTRRLIAFAEQLRERLTPAARSSVHRALA